MNVTQKTINALTIAAVCFFGGNLTKADDDLAKMNSANQALVDGKLDEALAQYDAIAETMPGSPLLAYNRGVVLYRQGQVDQARQAFVSALDTDDPELAAKAGFNLGNCCYAAAVQQAETERAIAIDSLRTAIAHYRSALQSNPADTDSRSNIELAQRLIKKLQQEDEQQEQQQQEKQQQNQQDQNQDSQNQDSNQSEQDQNNQSDSQDQRSDEQDSDESNESNESNSGDQTDDENQSEENTDGSNADQSKQEPKEQDSTGSENNELNKQTEQEQSGQQSNQPQPGEKQDDQHPQPQPGEEQQENQPEQKPGQQMSAGNADQQDLPDDGQQTTGYGITHRGEFGENIDKEEAMKMLQAIRDRDLLRRMQKLNETRRRYRPVDRDW